MKKFLRNNAHENLKNRATTKESITFLTDNLT